MHCEERRFRGDVIAEDAAVGGAVVELRDRAVALLPGSILEKKAFERLEINVVWLGGVFFTHIYYD